MSVEIEVHSFTCALFVSFLCRNYHYFVCFCCRIRNCASSHSKCIIQFVELFYFYFIPLFIMFCCCCVVFFFSLSNSSEQGSSCNFCFIITFLWSIQCWSTSFQVFTTYLRSCSYFVVVVVARIFIHRIYSFKCEIFR